MLDLIIFQKVMSDSLDTFAKFPPAHILINKKSYSRWLNRLRYYLSRVHVSIALYIIDGTISTTVDIS